jgi:hypothetical protein
MTYDASLANDHSSGKLLEYRETVKTVGGDDDFGGDSPHNNTSPHSDNPAPKIAESLRVGDFEFRQFKNSGGLRPTKKSNPCPACGDIKGHCRTTGGDLVLCAHSERSGGEWKNLGKGTNPRWDNLVPSQDGDAPKSWEDWQAIAKATAQRKAAVEQQERARVAAGLSRNERHAILSAKPHTLAAAQNADLLRRELEQWEIDSLLALGWLWAEWGGYGIAAVDAVTGQLIGGQKANDDRSKKYTWGIFANQNQLPETAELPIAFWKCPPNWGQNQPEKNIDLDSGKVPSNVASEAVSAVPDVTCNPLYMSKSLVPEIGVAEGFLKTLVWAVKMWRVNPSFVAIGAAGGQFVQSRTELMRAIEATGYNRLTFAPDAGMGFNTQVLGEYSALLDLLRSQEWHEGLDLAALELAAIELEIKRARVAVDGAAAVDDAAIAAGAKRNAKKTATGPKKELRKLTKRAEELRERLALKGVSVLWWNQFRKSDPDIDEMAAGATIERITPSEYKRTGFFGVSKVELHQYLMLNRFSPDRSEDARYLSTTLPGLDQSVRMAIKSALGSGKTHWMGRLFASYAKQRAESLRVLVIVPTNALAENFTGRMAGDFNLLFTHPRDFDFNDPSGNNFVVCCPESLHHVPDWWMAGAIVAVDEAVSIRRAIPSRNRRTERRAIEAKVIKAMATAHQVYLFDANLTDRVVAWFELDTDRKFAKVENTYQHGHQTTLYGYRNTLQAQLEQVASEGKRYCYCGDSVRRIIDLIAVLDPATSAKLHGLMDLADMAEGQALQSNPTEYLSRLAAVHEALALFLSPKGNSGISVDSAVKFDYVIEDFCGVLDSAGQSQLGKRVRDPGAHHLAYVAGTGLWGTGVSHSLIAQGITDDYAAYTAKLLDFGDLGQGYAAMVGALTVSPRGLLDIEELAIANFEKANLTQCYIWRQIQAGNHLEMDFAQVETIELKAKIKAAKAGREQTEAELLQQSEPIDRKENDALQRRDYLTPEQRAQMAHYSLEQRLPGFTKSEAFGDLTWLQVALKEGTIGHLENWFLLNNPEIAKRLSRQKIERAIMFGEIEADRVRLLYPRIKALRAAGLLDMIDMIETVGEVTAQDLGQFVWRLRRYQSELAIGPIPQNTIKAANKVLRLFGRELKQSRRVKGGDRFYAMTGHCADNPYSGELLDLFAAKYAAIGKKSSKVKSPAIMLGLLNAWDEKLAIFLTGAIMLEFLKVWIGIEITPEAQPETTQTAPEKNIDLDSEKVASNPIPATVPAVPDVSVNPLYIRESLVPDLGVAADPIPSGDLDPYGYPIDDFAA